MLEQYQEMMKDKAGLPYFYPLTFTLPEKYGEVVTQTLQTVGEGFMTLWLTWDQARASTGDVIIDNGASPTPAPIAHFVLPSAGEPIRDGMFAVELRSGASAYLYQSGPVLIRNLAGEPSTGRPVPFPRPIVVGPRDTLTVAITNLLDRTGQTPDQRRCDLCFVGIQAVRPLGT